MGTKSVAYVQDCLRGNSLITSNQQRDKKAKTVFISFGFCI
jgi:hypothetical protein